MLSTAITVLFTLTGVIATATVVYCLVEARAAYVRLMREGEGMRAAQAVSQETCLVSSANCSDGVIRRGQHARACLSARPRPPNLSSPRGPP